MHFKFLTFTSALLTAAAAVSAPSAHTLHEKRDAPLQKWAKLSKVKRDVTLPVRIGLRQTNVDNGVGEALLHEV